MLGFIVSVLPADWFSLSGWPGFSKRSVSLRYVSWCFDSF